MGWGPAFGGMIFISIATLFTTCCLCAATKEMRDEFNGDYKNFDENEYTSAGAHQTDQTTQEVTLA